MTIGIEVLMVMTRSLVCFVLLCAACVGLEAQQAPSSSADPAAATRSAEIRELRAEVDRISARLAALEAESGGTGAAAVAGSPAAGSPVAGAAVARTPVAGSPVAGAAEGVPERGPASAKAGAVGSAAAEAGASGGGEAMARAPEPGAGGVVINQNAATKETAPVLTPADRPGLEFLRGTTLNFLVDGYYGYNFNAPVGRVNLLRAYDGSSNSFSLNQAAVVVERLPTAESRVGGRLDLQFGQATEVLQGSPANEQQPQVFQNVFQAYGSWLAPVGSGLQLDFGKFASALGNEGNYTKDQIAYSRGFLFNYLPFYHVGLRANYQKSPKVGLGYWLVNGANDTEDLNPYKSQGFLLTLQPASTVQWNVNYYFGQETRDVPSTSSTGTPGTPPPTVSPSPNGREHIFDTYVTWQATPKLEWVGETDFVIDREVTEQRPQRVALGAVEGKYALGKSWYVGWRGEYFDDRGGLFSGQTQALKEATAVLNRDFGTGFQMKFEYRRDWSNRKFFLSDTAGALEGAQTTATVGLVYWWGMKQGSW